MRRKELLIIAGPNGSGKTTFAKSFLKEYDFEFINADEIAGKLSKRGKQAGNITSGKEYFRRLEELKEKGHSIILESTLSGRFLERMMKDFRKRNYLITIIFVYLNEPEMSIDRIRVRVSKGGHHVPDEDVRRRFTRGINHFWNRYRKMADHWLLVNNSESSFEQVAMAGQAKYEVINTGLFKSFQKLVTE